jgi:hypothetical protein
MADIARDIRGRPKNGKPYTGKGYKEIGTNRLHRILAEKALGRPLHNPECVHHMNGERNGGVLVICQDKKYHKLLHMRRRAYDATGDAHKRRCRFCKMWDDPQNLSAPVKEDYAFYHKRCAAVYYIRRYHIRQKGVSDDNRGGKSPQRIIRT